MNFYTRKMIKHEDLNHASRLFGGTVLSWIDEEAWVYACCQLKTTSVVTKFMSEVEFVSSARLGDVVEIGIDVVHVGTTSITLECLVRNKMTHEVITHVDRVVMVSVDDSGNKVPHGIKPQPEIKEAV